jgi:hypothetical protein
MTPSKRWLLLLHQVPPKPPYFRAKVLRQLNKIGALAIKKSAYLLPSTDDALEDFQWVLRQIHDEGGDAWLFEAAAVAGHTDESIVEAFRAARDRDYAALASDARAVIEAVRAPDPEGAEARLAGEASRQRLRRQLDDVGRIDFFRAEGRRHVEALLDEIGRALTEDAMSKSDGAAERRLSQSDLRGRTWVTRRGAKVDRIACAWLARRFVDPDAVFRFVDPETYVPAAGELRFDMFDGEFTHEGDKCSFEVLLERAGVDDPALGAIAEIVHDIDLKDSKFERAEAPGVALVIDGIVLGTDDDERRVAEGSHLFDALYARLRTLPRTPRRA